MVNAAFFFTAGKAEANVKQEHGVVFGMALNTLLAAGLYFLISTN